MLNLLSIRNSLYLFGFGLYIAIPIGVMFIFDYLINTKNREKIDNDYIFIIKKLVCLTGILILLFISIYLIFFATNNEVSFSLMPVIYYISIISVFIFFNYYSSREKSFRENIIIFLDSITAFFKDKFILHLLLFVFALIFKTNNSILLGIVGSYIFFFLTELNSIYKNKKLKGKYSWLFIVLKCLLNYVLMFYLADIETIYFVIINNEKLSINMGFVWHLLALIFAFIINYNYAYIEIEYNKIKKFIKFKLKKEEK